MTKNSVFECSIIPLKKVQNRAGNITVVEGNNHLPFDIRRIYYLYDIPGGENRGAHAHKNLYQLIVATAGSFEILLDDGKNKKIVKLNRPDYGLLVVPGIWRELFEFSSGSVCLVLASEIYSEDDYIRDYDFFKKIKKTQ